MITPASRQPRRRHLRGVRRIETFQYSDCYVGYKRFLYANGFKIFKALSKLGFVSVIYLLLMVPYLLLRSSSFSVLVASFCPGCHSTSEVIARIIENNLTAVTEGVPG